MILQTSAVFPDGPSKEHTPQYTANAAIRMQSTTTYLRFSIKFQGQMVQATDCNLNSQTPPLNPSFSNTAPQPVKKLWALLLRGFLVCGEERGASISKAICK